jgi:hypothetical protein
MLKTDGQDSRGIKMVKTDGQDSRGIWNGKDRRTGQQRDMEW